jgi:hypothetical protein
MFYFKKKKVNKPILSLDFDGTINSYTSGWKGPRTLPDRAMPGALEFIVNAQELFTVHIFSTRSNYIGGRRAMRKYLFREYKALGGINSGDNGYQPIPVWWSNRINFDYGDPWYISEVETINEVIGDIVFPKHKPPALVAIDDRAIQFEGKWPNVDELINFKPYKLGK